MKVNNKKVLFMINTFISYFNNKELVIQEIIEERLSNYLLQNGIVIYTI